MPELPRPDEIAGALASFPPKLSVLVKPLTIPEEMFESVVEQATGVEVPPGPAKMLAQLMESFEAGAPALPGLGAQESTPTTYTEKPEERPRAGRVFKEF